MVLPILKIYSNYCEIQIIDYAFDPEPIASLILEEDQLTTDIFYVLLKGYINQYIYGFNDGYDSAEDAETIE